MMPSLDSISALKQGSWVVLLAFQVLTYGAYPILVHLSKEKGQISFNSTAMNFLIEFFKLVICIVMLSSLNAFEWFKKRRSYQRLNGTDSEAPNSPKNEKENLEETLKELKEKFNSSSAPEKKEPETIIEAIVRHFKKSVNFSISSFLYVINNNLVVYVLLYMDSTSYQMLSNLRIFTTALLYYLIIGKKLTKIKWLSLVLLFVAGVAYSFGNFKSTNKHITEADLSKFQRTFKGQFYITEIGFVLMLISCLISGFSAVYNEYLLKRSFSDSIYLQSIYLYSYGSVFNLIAYFVEVYYIKASPTDQPLSFASLFNIMTFFKGFNTYTWLLVLNQVVLGILMSIVMKHSSNITRLFVISTSLVVTSVLSVVLFSLQLNIYFYLVFVAIMFALFLYNGPEIPNCEMKKLPVFSICCQSGSIRKETQSSATASQ